MRNNQDPYEWKKSAGVARNFYELCAFVSAIMPSGGSAIVDQSIQSTLVAKFQYAAEVNKMRPYGTPGLAIRLVQWNDGWRIFVASDEKRLAEIRALGVDLIDD